MWFMPMHPKSKALDPVFGLSSSPNISGRLPLTDQVRTPSSAQKENINSQGYTPQRSVVSSVFGRNQSLSTASGELHELTDLRCFQPWFFLRWAAVDGAKHNWLECWGYETVSILNGMSVLTLLPPRLGGHHGRRQKGCKSQRKRKSAGKCCRLDTM